MKKFLVITLALVALSTSTAFAWGKVGHEAVIAIAERHLTPRAKANIAKYMPYDLKKDAVWMDAHRRDKGIEYTSKWHGCSVLDDTHEYDPNPRLPHGDVVMALHIADSNLSHYEKLSDSAVVMNLRMVLHFVGDLHCPAHTHFGGHRPVWKCSFPGRKLKNFHQLYDLMPELIYGKDSAVRIAESIDECKKKEIRNIQSGTFADWAKHGADRNYIIYEWVPFGTPQVDADIVDKSKDLIDYQLRNAGYRLAYLLNKYFDK